MNIQRIWARGFPLFLSILFLMMLSACNLGATDEQQINVTDLPQQTQNAIQASPSPNQPTRTPSGVVVLPTPQPFPTGQLPPTLNFRPPPPILPTLTALPVNVFILSPIPGNVVAGNVQVIGAAMHPEFLQYQLEYGPDPNPSNLWYPITGGVQSPVFNGLLGIWNTNTASTPDGLYQLRLRVFLRNGVDWGNVVVNNIRVQNRIPLPVPTNTQVPAPIAAFTQDKVTGTAPLTVNFINLSNPASLITGFTWNFGDGTTSTEISPVKTFNNPGLYTVTLIATGPGGSSNVSRQITVQSANPPVAGFTADKTSGPAPLTVQFTNASTGGQITNYLWNFSDGTTSTQQNPSHEFTNVGTYNVILTVSGPGGVSSATRQITVGNPIQASIQATIDSGNPLRVNLLATVSGGSGTYTAYDWDFGNGQTLFGQSTPNTSVTYASANTYTITLTVTDSTGAKKTVTQPVTLVAPPPPLSADFTITQTTPSDLTVGFTGTGTGGSGSYTYSWNFGDGNTANGQTVNHTYATAGVYTVTLTINDGTTNTTTSKQVTIEASAPPPTATEMPTSTPSIPPITGDFIINQSSPTDLTIGLSASASGGLGGYTYTWDFGDGTGSVDQNPTHTYSSANTYTITLTISDGINNFSVSKQVTINALPQLIADFTITQSSPTSLTIGLDATASGGTGTYTFTWNFGDGNSGSGQNISHTYAVAATYTITLTVSDGVNIVSNGKQVVIDSLTPITGDFTITQFNPTDFTINLNATASGGLGGYTYTWDFGDGTGSVDQNPTHTYTTVGIYTITLTVSDGINSFSVSKAVNIQAPPPPPPPPYASSIPVIDNIGELSPDLSPVYNNGVNNGLSSSAFAIAGDQTAADSNFLRTIFNLDPGMSDAASIQATIDRFNTTGSFTRSSVAVGTLTAQDLLNTATNPACNGVETLLQCEMRLANGSIVIVSIGYQDAINGLDNGTFQIQINQIVQQALNSNVIPVLMTIQPSTNPTVNDKINDFNEIIITTAETARVPVINIWRAMDELPNRGLTGETPSVDPNGAGYLSNSPTAGANARNYYTLLTLTEIVNTLFTP